MDGINRTSSGSTPGRNVVRRFPARCLGAGKHLEDSHCRNRLKFTGHGLSG
jgi:hypothetical protein